MNTIKIFTSLLRNHTMTDSFTSETSDDEVDYGSFDIDAIPHTDSDQCMEYT